MMWWNRESNDVYRIWRWAKVIKSKRRINRDKSREKEKRERESRRELKMCVCVIDFTPFLHPLLNYFSSIRGHHFLLYVRCTRSRRITTKNSFINCPKIYIYINCYLLFWEGGTIWIFNIYIGFLLFLFFRFTRRLTFFGWGVDSLNFKHLHIQIGIQTCGC